MNVVERLEALSCIGLQPDGSVTRVSGSPEYMAACELVMKWMISDGFDAYIDEYGNVIGEYPGSDPTLKPIVIGSHIDTVIGGGKYDGALGVLAGLDVVKGGGFRHPIHVCAFFDEEVTMSGSIGYISKLNKFDLAAFFELHVEQGPVLDASDKTIGVVSGIVGQRRTSVTFHGTPNHAGTTPMDMRDDALLKAAEFALHVNRVTKVYDGLVATVGHLDVSPNKFSVIPGRVDCTLQIRDLSTENIENFLKSIRGSFLEAEFEVSYKSEPALCDDVLMDLIEESAKDLGYTYMFMPSRASHDAQNFPKICPTGMIFVPSDNGISHSGDEYTSPSDCYAGVDVLYHTIKKFDTSSELDTSEVV